MLADARERLRRARLYLVVEAAAEPVLGRGAARRRGHGPAARQARRRRRASCARPRASAPLCREHGALFWLNDRPDLALECGRRRRARGTGRHAGGRGARAGGPGHADRAVHPLARAVRRRARLGGRPAQRGAGVGDARPRRGARRPGSTTCATPRGPAASGPGSRSAGSTPANVAQVVAAGARRIVVRAGDPRRRRPAGRGGGAGGESAALTARRRGAAALRA